MPESNISQQIIKLLSKQNSTIPLLALESAFVPKKIPLENFCQAVYELLATQQIICTLSGVELFTRSLQELIDQEIDAETKEILQRFFEGDTRTSTHILVVKDFLKNRPPLEEDKFREIFRTYRFDLESFTAIFGQPSSTYRYLCETCKKGSADWRLLRMDTTQEKEVVQATTSLLATKGFLVDDVSIPFSPEGVIQYLLQKEQCAITETKLSNLYGVFLLEQAPAPCGLALTSSKFSAAVNTCSNIIKGKSSDIRYRNTNLRKDRQMIGKLKLNQYRNQYVSAEILYQKNEPLLLAGDIVNPLELIYLLKSFPEICMQYQMKFAKPPFLVFGNGNAVTQLKQLLLELSPISADALAKAYEQRYGLKANTVKARLMKEIAQYSRNGQYDMRTKQITAKQLAALSARLTQPWYFMSQVEALFKGQMRTLYQEYMSTQNLLQLGYRKAANIAYSSQYNSLDECLYQTEWAGDTFEVIDDLFAIPQIYGSLQKKSTTFEIIEYAPQKYLRLSFLKRNQIHKKDLQAFTNAVHQQVEDESYFTLKSIEASGFQLPLHELGFEDTFYYSVLKQSKKIQAKKVAGTYLFRKSKDDATFSDFLEYLLATLRSIDIYDLMNQIQEQYGITVSIAYIRSAISNTPLYYDDISEKLFIDYNEYFEEL